MTTTTPESREANGRGCIGLVGDEAFVDCLQRLGVTLLVSTYQAGKLMAVAARENRLSLRCHGFEQPMGIAFNGSRLTLGCRRQLWTLPNAAPWTGTAEPGDSRAGAPQGCHETGDIRVHELAWSSTVDGAERELWIVNTRHSCLCTPQANHKLAPRWWPPFVSKLAAEDRCHLNGLAMVNGRPKYVTALGQSDSPEGWRDRKANGGLLIDIDSGQIISHGLAMPHSPRFYKGRIWVLNSGRGELQWVDPDRGSRQTVVRLPGYTRGLAFHEDFAFVAMSQIRQKRDFGGLPIDDRRGKLRCGVCAVDLISGQPAGFAWFEAGCCEIFDLQVSPATPGGCVPPPCGQADPFVQAGELKRTLC